MSSTSGVSRTHGAFTLFRAIRIIRKAMVRKPPPPEPERVAIPMSSRLLARIDEYRWRERLPSRAEAIRALLDDALKRHERQRPAKPGE